MQINKIIAWWSGGCSSAVACKLAIDLYGLENTDLVFINTKNEDDDTYRFKDDCEKWYGKKIKSISNPEYSSIDDVWSKYLSLNVATGAICSTELKRRVREEYQKENPDFKAQVFGFDITETKRALSMALNYPNASPLFPLLLNGLRKKDCIRIVEEAGIDVPVSYKKGFHNNNCAKTGCVQGGIGYWQKIQREEPEKFEAMAQREHRLTELKGKPVTMLKDQSKDAKDSGCSLVFLKPHPDYPSVKDLSMMKGREPEPLVECNGYCGIGDLFNTKIG